MFDLAGYGPQLLAGMVTTVELSFLSLVVSFAIGLAGASAKLSKSRVLKGVSTLYTTLIRGVPDLVLMLLMFYSLQIWLNDFTDWLNSLLQTIMSCPPGTSLVWSLSPGVSADLASAVTQMVNDPDGPELALPLNPFTSGVITLGFIYGAYFTETFRGAFLAVPKGQLEAARAFGMRPTQVFRRILFPQMMRYALPGIGNNWQVILKATALVSLIGLSDIVKAAQAAGEATFRTFYFISVAGLVYLVLTVISNGVLLLLERKYSVGVRRAVL
jgi:histidine transport system permease protein